MKTFRNLFPQTRFHFSPSKQLETIAKEVVETAVEVGNNNKRRALIEAVDVLHATYEFLYVSGYSDKQILRAIRDVRDKNEKRGYYDSKQRSTRAR